MKPLNEGTWVIKEDLNTEYRKQSIVKDADHRPDRLHIYENL